MPDLTHELLDWYDANRRRLPWRALPGEVPDPYAVWLSEVMLQQTTVQAVKAYFTRFRELWPTVTALAAAPLEDVLREWAGLGYYARARNMHKCATIVATEHGGRFPDTEADLRKLPGIGDYTAAAIAAIAFNRAAAVVDGNVERVISRLYRQDTPLPAAKPEIRTKKAALTSNDRPGDFAQAMMDLGATVCTPRSPNCLLCPWRQACAAYKAGDMERYPVKAPKKEKPTRRAVSFWLEHDGHVLLERRAPKGLLGGMPGFFSTEWVERADFPSTQEWLACVPAEAFWKKVDGTAKHTFTHFHLETKLLRAKTDARLNIENGFWHPIDALADAGLPTVFAKIAKLASV